MGTLPKRLILSVTLMLFVPGIAFAQDDDEATPAKLVDASGRSIGRAAILDSHQMYGLYFKLWLDNGTRMRVLHPEDDARRDRPAKFTFRDYKVDPRDPNTIKFADELGSGIATLEPNRLRRDGDVESFSGSMQLTAKTVGDNEVPVTEPPQRFTIVVK